MELNEWVEIFRNNADGLLVTVEKQGDHKAIILDNEKTGDDRRRSAWYVGMGLLEQDPAACATRSSRQLRLSETMTRDEFDDYLRGPSVDLPVKLG